MMASKKASKKKKTGKSKQALPKKAQLSFGRHDVVKVSAKVITVSNFPIDNQTKFTALLQYPRRRPIASPLEVCGRRPRCARHHLHGAGIRKPSQNRTSAIGAVDPSWAARS